MLVEFELAAELPHIRAAGERQRAHLVRSGLQRDPRRQCAGALCPTPLTSCSRECPETPRRHRLGRGVYRRSVIPSSELVGALGEEPPAAIAALPAEVVTRLAGQIEGARRRQAAAMESGVKTALKGVPLPLRGVVRKALLG